ncbi:MAG: pilus assembly protein TadG [Proteobacteria bacterium SG_bin9]|nr:MAG: pilus assembly protein TadG [Proteobacteria bacterium SG_bin9]
MSNHSIIDRTRRLTERFPRDQRGNVATMFALSILPILGFIGAAVDYSRAANARTSMQAALDTAALMISKDAGSMTSAQITTKAQAYFNALYKNGDASNIAVTAAYTPATASAAASLTMTGSGQIQTDFMKLAGFPTIDFKSGSTTTWGNTKTRVAIALDVTGSMASDGKIDAMKVAAKNLIDTLKSSAKATDDVYVSIIPFAQMVNVGTSNKNASWIKFTGNEYGKCSHDNNYYDAYVSRFAAKAACEANGGEWNSISGKNYWSGCVQDRDQSYDTTKEAPTATATNFVASYSVQNGNDICPAQILPMTSLYAASDVTTVKNKIDSLQPAGGTNQPIGMHMAWLTLQSASPFNAPAKDANYNYADVIVLMSDGLNTIDRWYGNGADPSSQVDGRQTLLCNNIKNSAVNGKTIVFTIHVNTDGDPESQILKACADPGNYYYATSTTAMANAFSAIGASLSKLKLAK